MAVECLRLKSQAGRLNPLTRVPLIPILCVGT